MPVCSASLTQQLRMRGQQRQPSSSIGTRTTHTALKPKPNLPMAAGCDILPSCPMLAMAEKSPALPHTAPKAIDTRAEGQSDCANTASMHAPLVSCRAQIRALLAKSPKFGTVWQPHAINRFLQPQTAYLG